ncbi:MAG: DEAD/DEAH box helicase [Marinilabiliaceae bacterium]|nr:DEAD/DEAH box helicase [Marinilabiliaceae bacterium]
MEQLIVVIVEKRHLGLTLIPYWAEMDETPQVQIKDPVLPEHLKENTLTLPKAQQEIVTILWEINEQSLFKRFSRQKTLKLFYDALTPKMMDSQVRPLMEKTISQALEIVALDDTPLFYKNPNFSHIYPSDRIKVSPLYDQTNFNFTLNETGLTYSLRICSGDKEMGLTHKDVLEITLEPANILINNRLYRFQNIDAKKFRPFQSKTQIRIPERSVDTYMSSFVETCVRDHAVSAEGFTIINKDASLTPILSMEQDLGQHPILVLKFRYEKREYLAGTRSKVFVNLEKENNHYTFYRFQRELETEQKLQTLLNEKGLRNISESQYIPASINPVNEGEVYGIVEWLNHHSKSLTEEGFEVNQSFFSENYYTGEVKLDIVFEEDNDWFDVNAVLFIEGHKIPFNNFRKHIIQQKREYRLPNGAYFIIPAEWVTRYGDLMHFTKEKDDRLLLDKMHFNLLETAKQDEASPQWQERINELQRLNKAELLPIPDGLKTELRHYQSEGYSWMQLLNKNRFGGILADDMGLGKTIQTIALLLDHYGQSEEPAAPIVEGQLDLFNQPITGFNKSNKPATLIVMPTSLVHNWDNEIRKFAPQLKTYIYTGSNRIKSKDIGKILRHYHVVLTSYGVVRNDYEYLSHYPFLYLILDESQNIKNPTSKIYRAVSELKASHHLVLTGTPIENALVDLWAQMNFVNNGLLGNLNFFKNHYAAPIERGKDEAKEEKLRQLINPFILRRTKEMVAKELPPVTEQVLTCDMTPEQRQFYDREKSGIRNELLKAIEHTGINKNAILALKALTRLRQVANHPILVDDTYTGSSGKYQQIFENLENIINEKHKVLIFSSFVKDLELIEAELKERKWKYAKLIGATRDRESAVKDFTKNQDCRIFLISLKAGGVGLNLVEADYVFILNPWWNPAAESQAINRAHRIGQTKNVFVYKFISTDTIEEKIARLQAKKLELADTFISSNNPLKELNQEEIKELFA